MTLLALVVASTFAQVDAGFDGGVDVPYADADAGLYQVVSATTDAGMPLPAGWWLSDARMIKVGVALATAVTVNTENESLKRQLALVSDDGFFAHAKSVLIGFSIGLGVGVAATIALMFYLK